MTRPEKDEHAPAEPSAGERPHVVDQRRRRRGRWLLSLMVLVFLALAAFTVRWGQFGHRSNKLSAAYKASQPDPGFAIGDLGGMPVKVPRPRSSSGDAAGKVITRLHCTTSFDVNRSTCSQVWSMEKQGLRIKLSAQYRRPLLQHWQEIQPMVTQIVLGFRHVPGKPDAKPSALR